MCDIHIGYQCKENGIPEKENLERQMQSPWPCRTKDSIPVKDSLPPALVIALPELPRGSSFFPW